MSTPTDIGREWATMKADQIQALITEAETCARELLAERCYQNGVRGAATQIKSQLEDTHSTLQKLRKAIHDDFGSPEVET